MTDEDRPPGLPFGMSEETMLRVSWIVAAAFAALAIVSLLGEIFGWWNDLGEVGATVGSIVSVIVTVSAVYYNAGRNQVEKVHDAVVDNGQQLGQLDQLDTLDDIQFELDRQTGVLAEIRDRL